MPFLVRSGNVLTVLVKVLQAFQQFLVSGCLFLGKFPKNIKRGARYSSRRLLFVSISLIIISLISGLFSDPL